MSAASRERRSGGVRSSACGCDAAAAAAAASAGVAEADGRADEWAADGRGGRGGVASGRGGVGGGEDDDQRARSGSEGERDGGGGDEGVGRASGMNVMLAGGATDDAVDACVGGGVCDDGLTVYTRRCGDGDDMPRLRRQWCC